MAITDFASEDRPREKLIDRGASALSPKELVAILLRSGTKKKNAIELGEELINKFGGLRGLANQDYNTIKKIHGLGPAKALSIVAAFELAKRKQLYEAKDFKVDNPQSVFEYLRPHMADLLHEECRVLYFNINNEKIGEKLISKGGFTGTLIDPKVIFQEALFCSAVSFIISHNHPSGNLQPSEEDKSITNRLKEGGSMLGIKLLDHIIISQQGYFSFREMGYI